MSNFDKNMEKLFDLAPVPKKTEVVSKVNTDYLPDISEENLKADLSDAYEQTKTNIQDLIDQGKDALDEILQIAKAGQHPRAFEVYGTLLKNVVEANKELLSIQKQMREMDKRGSPSGSTTIDKAVFIGSTSELNKLLKNKE